MGSFIPSSWKFSSLISPIEAISSKHYFQTLSSHPKCSDIKSILQKISSKAYNGKQIIKIIENFQNNIIGEVNKKRNNINNNNQSQKFQTQSVLLDDYQNKIPEIFSLLASHILTMEKQSVNIPLLYQKNNTQIQLTKNQVVYLLALMAFNLVPLQQYHSSFRSNFNRSNNFSHVFSSERFKTKCVMEYFIKYFQESQKNNKQKFTIRRNVTNESVSNLLKFYGKNRMFQFKLRADDESIQQFIGRIKVDFANKYIGGGALRRGCVQEQIMFATHPQLFVSTLLCQSLQENQSLLFAGFKKYSKSSGYSYSTKYNGPQDVLPYKIDEKGRFNEYITAIDAVEYKGNPMDQFSQQHINREILKAYTGFKNNESEAVATGNWGCGAFKGNVSLKFLIQWVACSLAEKHMIYCPYGQSQQFQRNNNALQYLKEKSINQVYEIIINLSHSASHPKQNILTKIKNLKTK